MRLFIAVRFDDETVEKLSEIEQRLDEKLKSGSLVPYENLHMTLAFLGDIPEEEVVGIEDALDDVQSTMNFELAFTEMGSFGVRGKKEEGRTVWIGTEPSKQLTHLQKEIADMMRALGIDIESRKFVPHVTLARRAKFTADFGEEMLPQLLPEDLITTRVNSYALMESRMTKEGPVYEQICAWE